MIHHRAIAVLLAAVLLLPGCGFQLRGTGSIPDALAPMALDCASGTPRNLCDEVRGQLELYDLLADEASQPAHTLTVEGYSRDRRTSALSDRSASAEYEMTVSVGLNLTTHDDIPLLSDATLRTSEVYRADEEQVLSDELEEEGIEGMLQRELAQQVTIRLSPFTEGRIRLLRQQHREENNGDEP